MPEFAIETVGSGERGGGKRFRLDRRTLWMIGIAGTVLLAFLTVMMGRRKEAEEVVIDYGSYADAPVGSAPAVTPAMLEQIRAETGSQLAQLAEQMQQQQQALAEAQYAGLEALARRLEQTRQEQEMMMSQLASSFVQSYEQLSAQFEQRLSQLASDLERRVAQMESYAIIDQRRQNPAMNNPLPSDAPSWLSRANAVYYAPTRVIAGGTGGGYIITETREQMEEFARGGSRNVGGSYSMDFRGWLPDGAQRYTPADIERIKQETIRKK